MADRFTIFVSYDNRDGQIASELKTLLEDSFTHVDVYVAERNLEAGKNWMEQIKKELNSSDIIIALLSKKSIDNIWVYFESGAGFTEDKTIPIVTDYMRLGDLKPPMSLLQARMLDEPGMKKLIEDISKRIGSRIPKNHNELIKEAVKKIEAILGTKQVSLLAEKLVEEKAAPNAEKKGPFPPICFYFNYLINNYRVSVDMQFYLDRFEIQLFEKGGNDFVLDKMVKAKNFLPKPFDEYKIRNNRLIYKVFTTDEDMDVIVSELKEFLNRIESYKATTEALSLLTGSWKNEWSSGTEELEIKNDGKYFLSGDHIFDIEDLKYDDTQRQLTFIKVAVRNGDKRRLHNRLKIVDDNLLKGTENNNGIESNNYNISYSKLA